MKIKKPSENVFLLTDRRDFVGSMAVDPIQEAVPWLPREL